MSSTVNRTEQAEAVKGRTPEDVEREIASVIDELQRLKAEREALPAQVEKARAALDSWRLGELERQGQELGREIEEGQARLHQLYAERARLLLPEVEEKAEAVKAKYDQAHAAYLEAHEQTNRLGVEYDNARAQAQRLRQTAEENERRARELRFGLARQS